MRPTVSVIVPFAGSDEDLGRTVEGIARLALRAGDEVIVVDNRPGTVVTRRGGIHVVLAPEISTPAFARNRGAKDAHGEWLVFLDSDTTPSPTLLDDYFDPPPNESTAVLAGTIRDIAAAGAGAVGRRAVAQAHMSQLTTMTRERPYAQTANCAVRRSAFEQVGGFAQQARAGEDADLCFRLQARGWMLEVRDRALVEHRGRDTVRGLLGQLAQHGSGAAWVNRRFPGSFPPPNPRQLARRLAHHSRVAVAALRRRDREAAVAELLDLLAALAFELGRLLPNRRRGCRSVTGGSVP